MVADPCPYMTCQSLLAEAAAGNLEPRHVAVPLRGAPHRTPVTKDFSDALHVIATAPSHLAPIPDREEKEDDPACLPPVSSKNSVRSRRT